MFKNQLQIKSKIVNKYGEIDEKAISDIAELRYMIRQGSIYLNISYDDMLKMPYDEFQITMKEIEIARADRQYIIAKGVEYGVNNSALFEHKK